MFNVPERQLGVLGEVAGLDVVELGCGTAYFSAWLARRGARPVGVDLTPAQLATARRCQDHFRLWYRTCVPLSSGTDQAMGSHGDRRSGGTQDGRVPGEKLRSPDANSIQRGLQSSTRGHRFPVPSAAPAATGHDLSERLAITGCGHQR